MSISCGDILYLISCVCTRRHTVSTVLASTATGIILADASSAVLTSAFDTCPHMWHGTGRERGASTRRTRPPLPRLRAAAEAGPGLRSRSVCPCFQDSCSLAKLRVSFSCQGALPATPPMNNAVKTAPPHHRTTAPPHVIATWSCGTTALLHTNTRRQAKSAAANLAVPTRHAAGKEPGDLGHMRRKLLDFLDKSSSYSPDRILKKLPVTRAPNLKPRTPMPRHSDTLGVGSGVSGRCS